MKTSPFIKRLFASACTAITLATLATASFAPSAFAYTADVDEKLTQPMMEYIYSDLDPTASNVFYITNGVTITTQASFVDSFVTNYGTLEITDEGLFDREINNSSGTLKCTWETYEMNMDSISFSGDSTLSLTGGTITSSLLDVGATIEIASGETVSSEAAFIDTDVMNEGTLTITSEGILEGIITGGTVECTAETYSLNYKKFDEIETLSLTGGEISVALSNVSSATIEIASGATVSSEAAFINMTVTNYGTLEITGSGILGAMITTTGGTIKCTWGTYEENKGLINFESGSTLSLTGGTITSELSTVWAETVEVASGATVSSNASNIDIDFTIGDESTLNLTDGTLSNTITLGSGSTLNLNNVTIDRDNFYDVSGSDSQISVTDSSVNTSYVSISDNTISVGIFDNGDTSIDLSGSLAITLGMSEDELVDFAEILDEYGTTTFTLDGVDTESLTDISLIITNSEGVEQYSYSRDDFTISTGATGLSLTVDNTASVPEPSTATLSLLALAGLCARRKRCAALR